jgi:hypothetical protein
MNLSAKMTFESSNEDMERACKRTTGWLVRAFVVLCGLCVPIPAISQTIDGQISGRVRGLDGKPASEVRIGLAKVWNGPEGQSPSRFPQFVRTTDRSGQFHFGNIPPGRYYLLAGRVDAPVYYPGTSKPNEGKVFNVDFKSTFTGLEFQLAAHPGATVSGRVTANWGEGNRLVSLMRSKPTFLRLDELAEPDGVFVFHGVPPGTYELDVNSRGIFWHKSPIVVKDKDKAVSGIRRVASSFASVRGNVEVAGGGPVPRMSMDVQYQSGKIRLPLNGPPQFENESYMVLPTGRVKITLVDVPTEYHIDSFKYGTTDLLTSAAEITDTGIEKFSLKLSIRQPERLRRIRGYVRGIDRIPGASDVTLSGPSLMTEVTVPIGSDGSYEFSNLGPGNYSLRVARRERATIRLAGKDIESFDIELPKVQLIRGRVLVDGGGPLPRFDMDFDRIPEEPGLGKDDPFAGTFERMFPEGDVRVKFYGFPDIYELLSIKFGDTDGIKNPLHLVGENLPELIVTLRMATPTVRVTGKVFTTSTTAADLSKVRVAMSSQYQGVLIWVTAAADGSFEFPKVPPGIYALSSPFSRDSQVIVQDKDLDVGSFEVRIFSSPIRPIF